MKKIAILSAFMFFTIAGYAQTLTVEPQTPHIEVIGSAEMEVEPDEIRVSVTVGNYTEKNIQKISLEAADKKFLDILSSLGIKKEQIILKDAATNSYWSYSGNRSYENVRLQKRYEIILKSSAEVVNLLNKLPSPKEGIANVNISELKNKDIEQYRQQVKKNALRAAKDKARYLLQSVGDNVGKTIYVQELDEDGWNAPLMRQAMYSNMKMEAADSGIGADDIQMQKIKLKYRIKARFAID